MIELKGDVQPLCPHCEADIRKLWLQEIKNAFGRAHAPS